MQELQKFKQKHLDKMERAETDQKLEVMGPRVGILTALTWPSSVFAHWLSKHFAVQALQTKCVAQPQRVVVTELRQLVDILRRTFAA